MKVRIGKSFSRSRKPNRVVDAYYPACPYLFQGLPSKYSRPLHLASSSSEKNPMSSGWFTYISLLFQRWPFPASPNPLLKRSDRSKRSRQTQGHPTEDQESQTTIGFGPYQARRCQAILRRVPITRISYGVVLKKDRSSLDPWRHDTV